MLETRVDLLDEVLSAHAGAPDADFEVAHSHAPDVRVPTFADLLTQSPWKE